MYHSLRPTEPAVFVLVPPQVQSSSVWVVVAALHPGVGAARIADRALGRFVLQWLGVVRGLHGHVLVVETVAGGHSLCGARVGTSAHHCFHFA